jgi:phospholipid/cholesterol/gamma-HCH transport system permease protein
MTDVFQLLGGLVILFRSFVKEVFKRPYPWVLTLEQIYQVGYRSAPIVFITALSVGSVMALQFGLGMQRFGATLYIPKVVTLSFLRELGPMFAALMMAARVGAGIASEIGSMVVTQQIDAIRALGTSPIKKIVIPRVIACFIALPLLVAISNIVGFAGGLIVGATELRLDPQFYVLKAVGDLLPADYYSGFCKSFFFSFFISIPACYFGLTVSEGTRGVGLATTKAVVTSSVLIFVGDYFLTKLFWVIEQWIRS